MRKLFLIIMLQVSVTIVFSQNTAVEQIYEDLLESVGEEAGDETNIQEIFDDLEQYRQHPLNLNQATTVELQKLHLLSGFQIENLVKFRAKTGMLYSLYELMAIEGFSQELLGRIEPFVFFGDIEPLAENGKSTNDILLRAVRSFAFSGEDSPAKNEGSPERFYLRFKHLADKLEYGGVVEKDPGEAFFRKSNKHGFDYQSAFANFGVGRKTNRIFVGDYLVRFGQGLVASQGFAMGKSVETTQVARLNEGIKSYSSTDENQFFRGMACRLNLGSWSIEPFLSLSRVDASVDTLDNQPYFGAFQTSGYHRTTSEISGENTVTQFAGGGHLNLSFNQWKVGFTSVYNRFSVLLDRSDETYNWFLPDGRDHFVSGIDWKGTVKKVFLFGEAALSRNSGKAFLAGLSAKPSSNAEVSLVYRNTSKNYFSFFSNAFTESSKVNDEHGLYLGMKIYPAPKWIIRAYADFFRFGWIKYTTVAPSQGTEFLAQLTYMPSETTNIYLKFFQEEKEQRLIDGNLKYNELQRINRIRLNYVHDLSDQISLKSRIECSFYSKQNRETGCLVFQDVSYKPLGHSYSLNGRVAYFKTGGYNSRLYAYENDVLYSFAFPALYEEGIRTYLNYRFNLGNKLTIWIKAAATCPLGEKDESSGAGIPGKSEFKIQLRYEI